MDNVLNFDIDKALTEAGIDKFEIYEPYGQALGRKIRDEFLNITPAQTDLALISDTEIKFPTIRALKYTHVAWLESQRSVKKEKRIF